MEQEWLVGAYLEMARIRRFEERVAKLFNDGLVRGSTHLAVGQEAVAVGVSHALRPDDLILATYRGHHHCLARGMDMGGAFAEILGREGGVCRGRGGSMHLTDVSKGILGSYAIVGAHLPIAVGSAWASVLQGDDRVTVCFFGDGTTTIGAFHEAMNLAAVWKLPVVFVCENNQYSEYTPTREVSPVERPAADRASAYGMASSWVDGNDVSAVYESAMVAVTRARAGEGPTVVEASTYRQSGHSRSDPGAYRPAGEMERWLTQDPLTRLERQLDGRPDFDRAMALAAIDEEVDRSLAWAMESPEPPASELVQNVYASNLGGSPWRS